MDDAARNAHQSNLESLLFAYGEAMGIADIAAALGISDSDAREVAEHLGASYEALPERGLCLMRQDDSYRLGTKPENLETIERVLRQDFEQDLSAASLETLSIILYRAPVSRADIDAVRGVNSSFIVRNLLLRGLIEREQDAKGHHVFFYKPSFALLQLLGIASVGELPDFEVLNKKFDGLAQQSKEQEQRAADSIISSSVSE